MHSAALCLHRSLALLRVSRCWVRTKTPCCTPCSSSEQSFRQERQPTRYPELALTEMLPPWVEACVPLVLITSFVAAMGGLQVRACSRNLIPGEPDSTLPLAICMLTRWEARLQGASRYLGERGDRGPWPRRLCRPPRLLLGVSSIFRSSYTTRLLKASNFAFKCLGPFAAGGGATCLLWQAQAYRGG